jgi:putative DNA primase/helicase
MDKDAWLLNVANGTINLKTGEFKPHRREDLITKLAPVEYRPDTECPFWLDHLNKIFQGNGSLISFLQLGFGYSLTGITDERALFIAHGSGANGKSTTHEIFAQILGDYAVRTPTESILVKREAGIPNDLAKLKGARFVYCSEVEEGRRMAESLIKDLTGNDTISARFLHGEFFTFQPSFKLWVATNHKPVIRGTDNAIWSRIRLIPFTVSIPESDRIPRSRMMERLTPELPGILAWGVQGCRDWVQCGLGMPEEVREATDGYRGEMDILGGFIKECCVVSESARGTAKDLYQTYAKWAEQNGEKPASQRMFGLRLAERGFQQGRMPGGRIQWKGIGLETVLQPKE